MPHRIARALALGALISVVVTAASHVGVLAGWETRAVDTFLFFRDRVPAPDIVLVAIDDESFQALGERQPLPREYLATLAEFLLRSCAKVVAFDVVLKTATTAGEDGALLGVAQRWHARGPGRLVFASIAQPTGAAGSSRYALTPPFASDLPVTFGFANAPIGTDGVIRNANAVLSDSGGGYLPSLALAALAGYGGYAPRQLEDALRAPAQGRIDLPVRPSDARGVLRPEAIAVSALAKGPWRVQYTGSAGSIATFPSAAIYAAAKSGIEPDRDNPFSGKIVFVGATFADSRDFYPTPLGLMSGVEIHANIAHTLLLRRALLPPSPLLNLAALVGACVVMALLSLWLRPIWVVVVSLALVAVFVLVSYEAYTQGGYWLDFVGPLLGMTLYTYVAQRLAQRRLVSAFGEFVSPEVLERVRRDGARLGGEVRTVSVLMSDLRGFTTMAERLPPDQVTEVMNEYLTAMVDVIMGHRGMVSDFIGDGILAVFGAPSDDPDHAGHATRAALRMQAALTGLNAGWARQGRPPLSMGIAVNTGSVFAGNVGSPRKKKYAVMGDPVNTVSRMEGQNRELGTSILISAATLAAVDGLFVTRARGAVSVKGRTQPVELFELVGVADGTQSEENGS